MKNSSLTYTFNPKCYIIHRYARALRVDKMIANPEWFSVTGVKNISLEKIISILKMMKNG